jgi:hypothetical protein
MKFTLATVQKWDSYFSDESYSLASVKVLLTLFEKFGTHIHKNIENNK